MDKTVEDYVKEAEEKALKIDSLIINTINSLTDMLDFMKDEVFKNVDKDKYYELANKSEILKKASDDIDNLSDMI